MQSHSSTQETVKPEPRAVNLEETEQLAEPLPPVTEESNPFEEASTELDVSNEQDSADLNQEEAEQIAGGEQPVITMTVPGKITGQLYSL